MIRITIQKFVTEEYTEPQHFVVKETPTEITEESVSSYGGGSKKTVQYLKEYDIRQITKTRTYAIDLLAQQVVDDSSFDLVAVIKAVNGMK